MRRLRLRDLLASLEELSALRAVLARGGVVAFPTETFYALGADPLSERGVSRVFEIKGRDDGKPLLILFSSLGDLERLGVAAAPRVLDRFLGIWPAPLTVVLPLREPIAASRGASTLAVRLPAAPEVAALLAVVGPLTGTSANRSGEPPIAEPDELVRRLGADLDLVVDGGTTTGGAPSTIVDATGEPPVVLRLGAFPWPPRED